MIHLSVSIRAVRAIGDFLKKGIKTIFSQYEVMLLGGSLKRF